MSSHSSPGSTSCSCRNRPNHLRGHHKTSHHRPVTAPQGLNKIFQKHPSDHRNGTSFKSWHLHEIPHPDRVPKQTHNHHATETLGFEDDFVLVLRQPCAICDQIEEAFGGTTPGNLKNGLKIYCDGVKCHKSPRSSHSDHSRHDRHLVEDRFLHDRPLSRGRDIKRAISHVAARLPSRERDRKDRHGHLHPMGFGNGKRIHDMEATGHDVIHNDQGYYSRSPSPYPHHSHPSIIPMPHKSFGQTNFACQSSHKNRQHIRHPNDDTDFGTRIPCRQKKRETRDYDCHLSESPSSTVGQDGSTIGLQSLRLQHYDEIIDSQRAVCMGGDLNRECALGGEARRNTCHRSGNDLLDLPRVDYRGDRVQVDFEADAGPFRDVREYCTESSARFRRDGALKGVTKTVRFADGFV